MTSSFQPSEETFDDVQAHGLNRGIDGPEEDTEGHEKGSTQSATESKDVEAASTEDDTEGHRVGRIDGPDNEDDVEGHKRGG